MNTFITVCVTKLALLQKCQRKQPGEAERAGQSRPHDGLGDGGLPSQPQHALLCGLELLWKMSHCGTCPSAGASLRGVSVEDPLQEGAW